MTSPLSRELVPAGFQHGLVDIAGDDFTTRPAQQGSQVACPGCDIQHPGAGLQAGEVDTQAFPVPVYAEGHQVIHQVIAGGYRTEDFVYALGLLIGRDFLETEID